MSNTRISSNGFWLDASAKHHVDFGLLNGISLLLKSGSLADFGCGRATYAKALADYNFQVSAFDGNPSTPEMTDGFGAVLDLSKKFNLNKKFDCVVSLEVGEHIPDEFEQVYINNLSSHASGVIVISWAVPGQHGHGHVNCRPNNYIIREFQQRGFTYQKKQTNYLRRKSNLFWFRNTIMVFAKSPNDLRSIKLSEYIGTRITDLINQSVSRKKYWVKRFTTKFK